MIKDANKLNIQRLTNLYTRHQMQNSSQGPKNEQEFKKYIQGVDSATLEKMGIDLADINSLFVSDRDQQPFEIRYGVAASLRGEAVGLIFEKQGLNGVRQVGLSTIAVKKSRTIQQYFNYLRVDPILTKPIQMRFRELVVSMAPDPLRTPQLLSTEER